MPAPIRAMRRCSPATRFRVPTAMFAPVTASALPAGAAPPRTRCTSLRVWFRRTGRAPASSLSALGCNDGLFRSLRRLTARPSWRELDTLSLAYAMADALRATALPTIRSPMPRCAVPEARLAVREPAEIGSELREGAQRHRRVRPPVDGRHGGAFRSARSRRVASRRAP